MIFRQRHAHLVAQGSGPNPYAKHLEQAEQEVEMGNSAVHMARSRRQDRAVFSLP